VLAGDGHGAAAAGKTDLLGHLGDRADLEELVLVAGHEHDALVIADVDRQRDAHVGEDDGVIERDQPQNLLWLCGRRGLCVGTVSGRSHLVIAPYELTKV